MRLPWRRSRSLDPLRAVRLLHALADLAYRLPESPERRKIMDLVHREMRWVAGENE